LEDGERVVRPLKAFGSPLLDLCASTRFVDHQAMFDASFPEGWWYYFRSCDVATLTDEVIDITADHAQRIRSPLTAFPIFHLGGAVGRVGDDETAFSGRTAGHTFNINATTATRDGFEEEREWSRSFWSALQPHHSGVYVIPEGAGTVNPYEEDRPGVVCRSSVEGGQPSARRRVNGGAPAAQRGRTS
jgi:hypothetical protein